MGECYGKDWTSWEGNNHMVHIRAVSGLGGTSMITEGHYGRHVSWGRSMIMGAGLEERV